MVLLHAHERMIYWITERENIRKKKEAGLPAPWTNDKVMAETYFCNVNREDDRVTRWIRNNWQYPTGDAIEFYDFDMIVARLFNQPNTLEKLGQPSKYGYDWIERARTILFDMKSRGERIWNAAYIVSTNGKKLDKITYILNLLDTLAICPTVTHNAQTLREAHQSLMEVEGLASFLAAQVVADLKNTKGHPLQEASDWKSFSSHGPGSLRGLGWFFGRKVTAKNYQECIEEAYSILELELPDEILEILCFQNLQNCFCEYDKFMRVSNRTGRSKRKYKQS